MKKAIIISSLLVAFTIVTKAQSNNSLLDTKVKQLPQSTLVCYPNPVQDQLTVNFDNNTKDNVLWSISDLSGRIIANGVQSANQSMVQIETGNYQKGMFLLTIATADGNDRKTVRFVKS